MRRQLIKLRGNIFFYFPNVVDGKITMEGGLSKLVVKAGSAEKEPVARDYFPGDLRCLTSDT